VLNDTVNKHVNTVNKRVSINKRDWYKELRSEIMKHALPRQQRKRNTMCQPKFCQLLHNSAGTSCITYPGQIEAKELEGYSRLTCNKHCAFSLGLHERRRRNWQARPSTRFVDHIINLPWRNFYSPEIGAKFRREVPLFWRYPNFLIMQFRIKQRKLPCPKPALSMRLFQYSTGLWRTDRQTDRHTTTAYIALA